MHTAALARLLLLILALSWSVTKGQEGRPCLTPTGESARCIAAGSCLPIADIINRLTGKNVSSQFWSRIRSYKCGDNADGPLVCCPSKPIRHPNERLLPQARCGIGGNTRPDIPSLEFPWIAVIWRRPGSSGPFKTHCSGTLINKRYVLTAAMCVEKMAKISIGVGGLDKDEYCDRNWNRETCVPEVQEFEVSPDDAIVHPEYKKSQTSYDVALVKLRTDAADYVIPVCLPISDSAKGNQFTHDVTVAGWFFGVSNQEDPYFVKTSQPVIPGKQCSGNYKHLVRYPPNMTQSELCVGISYDQYKCKLSSTNSVIMMDKVRFDDGVERNVQYGMALFGANCGLNLPDVYMRVTSHVDWILDNITE